MKRLLFIKSALSIATTLTLLQTMRPALADINAQKSQNNYLSQLELQCGRRDSITTNSLEDIRNYLAQHPNDARAHYVAGLLFDTIGMESLAGEQFQAADAITPNYVLDQFHDRMTKNLPAFIFLKYLSKQYPKDPGLLFAKGQMALVSHRIVDSINLLKEAVKVPNPWPGAYSALSQLLYGQSQLLEAGRYAKLELQQSPRDIGAQRVQMLCRIRLGANPETLEPELDKLAARLPKDPLLNLAIAQVRIDHHDYEGALVPAIICAGWGETPGQLKISSKLLTVVLQKLPEAEVASRLDALCPADREDVMKALLRQRVGDVYAEMGNHSAAVRQLLQALKMSTLLAGHINYRLAQEYTTLHRDNLALYFASTAADLRPDDQGVQRSFERWKSMAANHDNDIARRLKDALRQQ